MISLNVCFHGRDIKNECRANIQSDNEHTDQSALSASPGMQSTCPARISFGGSAEEQRSVLAPIDVSSAGVNRDGSQIALHFCLAQTHRLQSERNDEKYRSLDNLAKAVDSLGRQAPSSSMPWPSSSMQRVYCNQSCFLV